MGHRMGGRRLALALLAFALVASATPAYAALWIEFEPPKGVPGTAVEGHTMGDGAFRPAPAHDLPAFIYPTEGGDNRVPIGYLRVDRHGNGTLNFVVPDVPPSKYSILLICEECASYSSNMTEVLAGEFRVLGDGRPGVPMIPPAPREWDVLGTLLLVGIVVAGVAVYVRRGRMAARSTKASEVAEPR